MFLCFLLLCLKSVTFIGKVSDYEISFFFQLIFFLKSFIHFVEFHKLIFFMLAAINFSVIIIFVSLA